MLTPAGQAIFDQGLPAFQRALATLDAKLDGRLDEHEEAVWAVRVALQGIYGEGRCRGRRTVASTGCLDLRPLAALPHGDRRRVAPDPRGRRRGGGGVVLRLAADVVENPPRRRLRLPEGALAVMPAVDVELGIAGLKTYAAAETTVFVVVLFDATSGELVAVIEADRLGQLRTGAASGVAAKHLARPEATITGVIGCGWQAESQVAGIRAAVPGIERVVAYCRTPDRLAGSASVLAPSPARAIGTRPSRTSSSRSRRRPIRCCAGSGCNRAPSSARPAPTTRSRRELDNVVLERAAFVCCDLKEQARIESGDLIEPVERGVLDWLEVHELHEVVAGELHGRQQDDDIVLFKSNGLAAWDLAIGALAVERARERGVGTQV